MGWPAWGQRGVNNMKGMKLIAAGLLPLAILLSWTTPEPAAASSATLNVQATIRPWLKFSASQPFGSYQVTEQDIRRGYLDLPQALTLQMQTNIPEEVSFEITSNGPERIFLHENGSGMAGALVIAGNHPAVPVTRVLDLRIMLPANARTGTYPLQVALAPMAY